MKQYIYDAHRDNPDLPSALPNAVGGYLGHLPVALIQQKHIIGTLAKVPWASA
jgi:hypothetical protein